MAPSVRALVLTLAQPPPAARAHAASTSVASVAPAGTLRGTHWVTRLMANTRNPLAIVTAPSSTISSRLAV